MIFVDGANGVALIEVIVVLATVADVVVVIGIGLLNRFTITVFDTREIGTVTKEFCSFSSTEVADGTIGGSSAGFVFIPIEYGSDNFSPRFDGRLWEASGTTSLSETPLGSRISEAFCFSFSTNLISRNCVDGIALIIGVEFGFFSNTVITFNGGDSSTVSLGRFIATVPLVDGSALTFDGSRRLRELGGETLFGSVVDSRGFRSEVPPVFTGEMRTSFGELVFDFSFVNTTSSSSIIIGVVFVFRFTSIVVVLFLPTKKDILFVNYLNNFR